MENDKKLELWYRDNVVEDETQCKNVAGMAQEKLLEKFDIGITPEQVMAIYCITYDQIIQKLREKREDSPDQFVINIANVVKIGYDNVEDDGESETLGNFNVFIEHVGGTPKSISEDGSTDSIDACNQWMHANTEEQKKIIETIAAAAIKALSNEVDIVIAEPVVIFPIWVTTHEALVKFVEVARADENSSDYFMNFCNALEIHCQLQEDGTTAIVYKPNISEKLGIKSNVIASSASE